MVGRMKHKHPQNKTNMSPTTSTNKPRNGFFSLMKTMAEPPGGRESEWEKNKRHGTEKI